MHGFTRVVLLLCRHLLFKLCCSENSTFGVSCDACMPSFNIFETLYIQENNNCMTLPCKHDNITYQGSKLADSR